VAGGGGDVYKEETVVAKPSVSANQRGMLRLRFLVGVVGVKKSETGRWSEKRGDLTSQCGWDAEGCWQSCRSLGY